MKLSQKEIRRIIQEELQNVIHEGWFAKKLGWEEDEDDKEVDWGKDAEDRRRFLKGAGALGILGATGGMAGVHGAMKGAEEAAEEIAAAEERKRLSMKNFSNISKQRGTLPIQDPRLQNDGLVWEVLVGSRSFYDLKDIDGDGIGDIMGQTNYIWIPPEYIPDLYPLTMSTKNAGSLREYWRRKSVREILNRLNMSKSTWAYTAEGGDIKSGGKGVVQGASKAFDRYPGPGYGSGEKGPQPDLYRRQMLPLDWGVTMGVLREKLLLKNSNWLWSFKKLEEEGEVPKEWMLKNIDDLKDLLGYKYNDRILSDFQKLTKEGSLPSAQLIDWKPEK